MADLSLVFDILARDKASDELHKVGDQAERTGSRVKAGLGVIAGALAALGIGAFVSESIASLQRIERINAQTEAVIRSTGGAAGVTAQHIEDYAGALENATATEAESIQQGANLLATFTNIRNGVGPTNDIFDQTVSVATDMARALNTTGDATIDMSGTAVQLGKALNDPIKGISALQKVGVSFTQTQKDQIAALVETGDVMGAQRIILAELTKEFGGAGEAFAATTAGKIELAKHALGTFGETILSNTLPAIADLASFAADGFNAAAEGFATGEVSASGFDGVMQGVGVTVGVVADGVGFLVSVGQGLIGFLGQIPGPILLGVGAMTAFALLSGPVAAGFGAIAGSALAAATSVAAASTSMAGARAAGAGLVGLLGGPWAIAFAAVAVGVGVVSSKLNEAEERTDSWANALLDGTQAADQLNEAYLAQFGGEGPDWLGQAAEVLGFASSLDDAQEQARALYEAMSPLDQAQQNVTHDTNQLAAAIDRYGQSSPQAAQAAELLVASNERLANRQAAVEQATAAASGAQGAAAITAQTLADTQKQLADDTSAAKQQVDAIRLALEQFGGAAVNTDDLVSAYQSAIADAASATEGLTGNVVTAAGGFDLQTEAGRAAQAALSDLRSTGLEVIANQAQLGESTELLGGRAVDLRAQFINTAQGMGVTADQANILADRYELIPSQVVTEVQAQTGRASSSISEIAQQLRALDGTTVSVSVLARAAGNAVGSLLGFPQRAAGGPVTAGGTYLVGEEGPELVQFGASGFVTPATRTEQVLSSAERFAPPAGGAPGGGADIDYDRIVSSLAARLTLVNVEHLQTSEGMTAGDIADELVYAARVGG